MKEYFLYFDESGNLGVKDRYFVIACILTENPKELENKMKKVLLHIKKKYKNTKWNGYELKANSCKPWIKEIIYKSIIEKNIKISYIVADKVWIEKSLMQDKNCLYNYLLSVLLDNFKEVFRNNNVNLILDNKTVKVQSINSFEEYIKIHINYTKRLNSNITVKYMDSSSKEAYIVQAADYIANAVFAYYEHGYKPYYELIESKIDIKELFPRRKFGKDSIAMKEIALTNMVDKK